MSLYDDPEQDQEQGGGSPYAAPPGKPTDEEDAQQQLKASPYSGDASIQTAPNADWFSQAPEAAGASPFSTTPEGAPPRDTMQMGKADIPKVGESDSEKSQAQGGALWRSPHRDAADRALANLEKERTKSTGVLGTLFAMQNPGAYNAVTNAKLGTLQKEYSEEMQAAQYDENRMGQQPQGKPVQVPNRYGGYDWVQMLKGGGQQIIGPAPEPAAVTRAKSLGEYGRQRAAAMEKSYVDTSGQRWYVDPQTGQPTLYQAPGRPAQGNVLDADNPAAQSPYSPPTAPTVPKFPVPAGATDRSGLWKEATDAQGNVTAYNVETGEKKSLGPIGQGRPGRADEEERIERDARTAMRGASLEFAKNGPGIGDKNPPKSAREAGLAAYVAAGGNDFRILHPAGEQKPVRTPQGTVEVWTSDGKKFNPPSQKKLGKRPPLASSHG
jgi:hypothetical protein